MNDMIVKAQNYGLASVNNNAATISKSKTYSDTTSTLKERTLSDESEHYGNVQGRREMYESQVINFLEDLDLRNGKFFDMKKPLTKTVEKDKENKMRYTTYTDAEGKKLVIQEKLGLFGFSAGVVSQKEYDVNGNLIKEEVNDGNYGRTLTNYDTDGNKINEATHHGLGLKLTESSVRIFLNDGSYVEISLSMECKDNSSVITDSLVDICVCDKDGNRLDNKNLSQEQMTAMMNVLSKYNASI